MKYFPLIWAGLWRKPARTIFTFLSIAVAFILFGLLGGLDDGFAHALAVSRMDRLFVDPRFGGREPMAYLDQIARVPGVKVVEEEKVPETVDVQKSMEGMITQDGAKLIFPTSFGYFDPHVLEVAKKYPDVIFLHAGGLWVEGKHPKNVGSISLNN